MNSTHQKSVSVCLDTEVVRIWNRARPVMQELTSLLPVTRVVLRVLLTRLLLALGLSRGLTVRAVLDTTVMLRQGHAVHALLAGTRVSLGMVVHVRIAQRVSGLAPELGHAQVAVLAILLTMLVTVLEAAHKSLVFAM